MQVLFSIYGKFFGEVVGAAIGRPLIDGYRKLLTQFSSESR